MGLKDWLTGKGEQKSADNIVQALVKLVPPVRARVLVPLSDLQLIEQAQAADAAGKEPPDPELLFAAAERWQARVQGVIAAQKELYKSVHLWSNLSPERSFNQVILPMLLSGTIIEQSDPCFDSVVVAAYRVCEAAAKERGVDLRSHVSENVVALVDESGDTFC